MDYILDGIEAVPGSLGMGFGKKLKMTKKAIAARRAYRRKKSSKRSRRSSPKRRKISQKTAHARAKRAMKLHHSKGISLKQAWRIVLKKNKFGAPPNYSKDRATIRSGKRVQKGMRKVHNFSGRFFSKDDNRLKNPKIVVGDTIHWNPDGGYGQYEDWYAKVRRIGGKKILGEKKNLAEEMNSFGDSVCGRGYEVNRNWKRTKGQRECLKECDFYEIRDNKTNKCKKMKMVNKTRGYVPPRPPSRVPRGYEINPETGRQRKICPPGHYRNPDTGRCKRIQSSVRPLISRKNYEDLDELDSVNFRWSKKTRGNLPLSMQYGHSKSCFGAVPCDCGM